MSRYLIYTIRFTKKAKKQFEDLAKRIREEIAKILEEEIAKNPLIGKSLKGALKGLCSRRVGNLRIIYQPIKHELVIIVINLEHRKNVYRSYKFKK